MIINLFSTFDPCTGFFSLNWFRSFIIFLILNYNFWLLNNNVISLHNFFIIKLNSELILTIPLRGSSLMFLRILTVILFNNFFGLMPYVFTSSSHLIFSLRLALPTWLAFIIFGWLNRTNSILSHLVPFGTPLILMPLIVVIETTRNLIRPGSLAVRLSANIIAGHLLISLLGSNSRFIIVLILLIMFIIMILFEIAVRIIQSYVFITLLSLYSREI